MQKIVVIGCAGRMGQMLVRAASEIENVTVAGGTEIPGSQFIGRDAGELAGLGKLGAVIAADLNAIIDDCDTIIDFSVPQVSLENYLLAAEKGKSIVIGTTGFSKEQLKIMYSMEKSARCVFAPNMSVGVNVLFSLVREAARLIGDEYDIEIIEAHHKMKKDSPSGTAVKLGEIIADTVKRDISKVGVYHREGEIGVRKPGDIGFQTIRGGDIVGDHTVMFIGTGERLELTHKATNRANFAVGAVRAAVWLEKPDRRNGIYNMHDVLGIE